VNLKKNKIFSYFTAIILFWSIASYAQLEQNAEVKMLISSDISEEFEVINLPDKSLLVLNTQTSFYGRNTKIILNKFDSNLKLLWKTEFEPGKLFVFHKFFENQTHFYALFKEIDKTNVKILKIDLERGDGVMVEAKMLTLMDIDFFAAIENKVVIAGKYNDRPIVELLRLFDKSSRVLPYVYSNHTKIITLEVNKLTDEIYIMMRDERKCKFYFLAYDYEGKLLKNNSVGEKNKVILSGNVLTMPNGVLMLAGSYSENCSNYSSGFYLMPLLKPDKINYYDFNTLQNFLAYLPEKRQAKIKNRISEKKIKGKELKLRYRINLQQPLKFGNEIVLLAEVYYPEFRNTSGLDKYGVTTRGTNTIDFKQYNLFKYTHAILVVFNLAGEKIWDYSINLRNIESGGLNPMTQISKVDNDYLVAYPKDHFINTTLINKDQLAVEFVSLDFKTANPNEQNLADLTVNITSWYDHTYYAFGEKMIRAENGILSKEYFYLSKLTYNNPKRE